MAKHSLRDDPEAQRIFTLLMAGRASERDDLKVFLQYAREKATDVSGDTAQVLGFLKALRAVEMWMLERDERC